MKLRSTLVTAVALSLLVLAVPALAGSHSEKTDAAPAAGPSAAEMEAWQKSMTPGPEHQQLAKFAGDWTYVNKAWMAPGQPPIESTGTMHGEAVYGGRYVVEDWSGEMMGQPFQGRGTTSYNNVSKEYENTWYDSMSTGIWYSTGKLRRRGRLHLQRRLLGPDERQEGEPALGALVGGRQQLQDGDVRAGPGRQGVPDDGDRGEEEVDLHS